MANWKRNIVDSSLEKHIITGMIVSDTFVKEMYTVLNTSLLKTPFTKIIADWCISYFEKYGKSPNKIIQDIYESHARNDLDEDLAELISKFLTDISEQYDNSDKFNCDYYLDQANTYIRTLLIENLVQDLNGKLADKDVLGAENDILKFKKVERNNVKLVNVFTDKEAIKQARIVEKNEMFSLPGVLGEVIGPFRRGNFVGIVAPASRGKSWWLQSIGMRAAFCGYKTLFISLEMTQDEVINRVHQYILGTSFKEEEIILPKFDCRLNQINACKKECRTSKCGLDGVENLEDAPEDYSICTACRYTIGFQPSVWFEKKTTKEASWRDSYNKGLAVDKLLRTGKFQLVNFPSRSINILQLKYHIESFEFYNDFVPDVIVLDYPDILNSLPGKYDPRHKINETWEYLRGMGQEKHCLMVVSSHSNKKTYNKNIGQDDLSEEGRKLNHLTHCIGLNQTNEEKEKGIMRINMLKRRGGRYVVSREVTILQQLDIGKPYLDSIIIPKIRR